VKRELPELLDALDDAFAACGMLSRGGYILSGGFTVGAIVDHPDSLPRSGLPRIDEVQKPWERATLDFQWESCASVLGLSRAEKGFHVSILFEDESALERPGRPELIRWMVGFLEALHAEAAVLCEAADAQPLSSQARTRQTFFEGVLSRFKSGEDLSSPLVALVRTAPLKSTLEGARAVGLLPEPLSGGLLLLTRA